MTPPPSSHSSSATYHRIPWSLIIQCGGLVLALIALFAASTKYPIVNWIGNAREDDPAARFLERYRLPDYLRAV